MVDRLSQRTFVIGGGAGEVEGAPLGSAGEAEGPASRLGVEGLTAVAAPIRASERLVGAIAAALVSQRLGELGLDRVVQSVSSAAAVINLKLAGG